MPLSVAAVIPARMSAQRLPGKPLLPIAGRPMLGRVVDAVRDAKLVHDVIVATEDIEIVEYCQSIRVNCVNTGPAASGTDRVAAVARTLGHDIVINVQGDEPLISAETVDAVVRPFEDDERVEITTASRDFNADEDPNNPNNVKVVTDRFGRALYFSRSLIPFVRGDTMVPRLHLGIYAFRRDILLAYAALPPTQLENAERLEQLRALWNGISIHVVGVQGRGFGVDTIEDLHRVEKILAEG